MKYLIVCILLSVLTEIVVSNDILCLSTDNENCDPCSKNEVLVTVPDCIPERTCQKPIPWPTALICSGKIKRCECDLEKGYIRDENTGSCVHIKQCEVCKKNEVYNENPSCLPEPTCQNPNPQQSWSSESCEEDCEPRCECEEGCIRDETSKKCIPIESCPAASCCENEVWEDCASRCIPERTCRNQCPEPTSDVCTLDCVRRCECDWENGYVRDDCTDECVRVEECQDTCCPGETLNECASACLPEPTCFYRYPDDTGVVCDKMCVVRYECDAELGYIRDPTTGKCTLECPDKCGPNQVLGCKPCCEEATCCDPNPGPCDKKCTDICIQECLCAKGYVRNTEDGTCIPEKSCPDYN